MFKCVLCTCGGTTASCVPSVVAPFSCGPQRKAQCSSCTTCPGRCVGTDLPGVVCKGYWARATRRNMCDSVVRGPRRGRIGPVCTQARFYGPAGSILWTRVHARSKGEECWTVGFAARSCPASAFVQRLGGAARSGLACLRRSGGRPGLQASFLA